MIDLAAMLQVQAEGEDRFVAVPRLGNRNGTLFGGVIIGQAVTAAATTVDVPPHVIFCRFFRAGERGRRVTYQVTRDYDGTNFSGRRVTAAQDRLLADVSVSYQAPEGIFAHQDDWTAPPPDPETLSPLSAVVANFAIPDQIRNALSRYRALDVRPVEPAALLGGRNSGPQGFWIRCADTVRADPGCWPAAIVYVSDFLLASAGMLRHSDYILNPQLFATTLNHTVYLHAIADPSEWLFEEIHSPWSGAGRTLNLGRIFTAEGRLVATTVQEGLLRRRG